MNDDFIIDKLNKYYFIYSISGSLSLIITILFPSTPIIQLSPIFQPISCKISLGAGNMAGGFSPPRAALIVICL